MTSDTQKNKTIAISLLETGAYYNNKNNFKKAFKYYKKSAEKGNAEAQHNCAVFYDQGVGVTKNEKLAKSWFKKASLGGFVDSQYNLGVIYQIENNIPKALYWFKRVIKTDPKPILVVSMLRGLNYLLTNKNLTQSEYDEMKTLIINSSPIKSFTPAGNDQALIISEETINFDEFNERAYY